jgi:hexosaminidase
MDRTAIVPLPAHIGDDLEGSFELNKNTTVKAVGRAQDIAAQFISWIQPATGFKLSFDSNSDLEQSSLVFKLDETNNNFGLEGYQLEVFPNQVTLTAGSPAGLRYAAQTLRQLLPGEIFSPQAIPSFKWHVPCVRIFDRPRFRWRGSMLDVCRHFMPVDFIYRFLDLLALHKMNTFHWHLTEDQGWRIEIKKYPHLTEIGGWRKQTMVGHYSQNRENPIFDGTPHGGFYTQDEIKKVVAYADNLGINVVPEIEMPGHAQAAIAAYPHLGNASERLEVSTGWGIHEHVYNVEESTLEFLQDVLEEVLSLFPSKFIHIGGDEVPKKEWKESHSTQERMRALSMGNEEELQSYFIHRMDQFLTDRGRRLVGWDEILEGGLAPNATVMSWRGENGGITAAQAGHDVVMAPNIYTYFDYYQSEDRDKEPLAIGGYLPLEKVYQYEPIPEGLENEKSHHILGTQCQIWTEYIASPEQVEYMAFPRMCALAEVAWSPLDRKDLRSFLQRLKTHLLRLDQLEVNYRR